MDTEKNVFETGYVSGIKDSREAVAKAICIGCGYLKDNRCTYTGGNCTVSKPMLQSVMKALDRLQEEHNKEKTMAGRKGYGLWKREKENNLKPQAYGEFLQKRRTHAKR